LLPLFIKIKTRMIRMPTAPIRHRIVKEGEDRSPPPPRVWIKGANANMLDRRYPRFSFVPVKFLPQSRTTLRIAVLDIPA